MFVSEQPCTAVLCHGCTVRATKHQALAYSLRSPADVHTERSALSRDESPPHDFGIAMSPSQLQRLSTQRTDQLRESDPVS